MDMRQDCEQIVKNALNQVRPDGAVCRALAEEHFGYGRLILVAVGKAAWSMANAACEILDRPVDAGIVITKYGHSGGPVGSLELYEAGHPVPDENTFRATARALELTKSLSQADTVLFLLSGGGSALFEQPLIPAGELQDITNQLLACGADIVEINTIRKRLSAVKGGRFAQHCIPARVFSVVLSDIIGNPMDMIASGPAYPDSSTSEQAEVIVKKYGIHLSAAAREALKRETPKRLDNVDSRERNARWYYYSAIAHSGLGNNVAGLEHARKASALEPDNFDYRQLVQQFESGGSWYEQRQAAYGYPTFGGGNLCLKFMIANMICNFCCLGGGCCGGHGMYYY